MRQEMQRLWFLEIITFWRIQDNIQEKYQLLSIFRQSFDAPSKLFISHYLDWDLELTHGFMIKTTIIIRTGKKIKYNLKRFLLNTLAVSASKFYSIRIKWYWSHSNKTMSMNLKLVQGDRTIIFSIDHKFKDAKNGLISLTGDKHTKSNQIVEVKIEEIGSQSVDVSARIYSDSQVEDVRFNILLGTNQSSWSSPAQAEIYNPPLYRNQQVDYQPL